MLSRYGLAFAGLATLAGCGATPVEQALYGAALGTVAAAHQNAHPVRGAVYGATANLAYCQTFLDRCD